jgi:RimJ/RimL family protein N-acetyltransferase
VEGLADAAITTSRLTLVPLLAEDADAVAQVLDDERLYEFIGGRPSSFAALRDRYAAMASGSPDPDEIWLNWIVRRRADDAVIGTVQATIGARSVRDTADVAWVIGVGYQNQGYASEAAGALVEWLRERGADTVVAHIHPGHLASGRVASRAGLRATGEYDEDGEQIWRTP